MGLQGKITRWDDDKGFGFITGHGDQSVVFVHIKAFSRTSRRPELGDIVHYEIVQGKNGKPSAERVRFSDQALPKKPPSAKRKGGSFAGRFAVFYACFLFTAAFFNRISWLVVVIYFALSLLTFIVYVWDKSSAKRGRWRTAESSLHLMGLLGGWPGALAAQRLLRHKSSKREFLRVFWATVLLNVVVIGYLVWIGDSAIINRLIERVW
jgi:uncharacterized membrane protein YsdA (DUF1294 family)/cold shock CspA family protein